MKKLFYALSVIAIISSCTNQDIEFKDFDYQGVYFPYQTPLRTLMMGDEVVGDNTIDLEHAFSIGASVGGVYENTKDRLISIELATELAENLTDGDGNPLEILPSDYYNATLDKIVIPTGSFIGKVRVDLTDAFFQDSLSTGLHYIIPIRMTDIIGDTILSGIPKNSFSSPDPRISDHWIVEPKNYVLFGIKYINPTHGMYLLRGKRTNTGDSNDSYSYSTRYLVDNDMAMLKTKSLTENYMLTIGGSNKESSNDKYSMVLSFNESDNTVSITQKNAATVPIEGAGKYFSKNNPEAESYNGKKHRTIYLNYIYEDDGKTYQVNDSLVFVDTDMKFEKFEINVIQ